MIGCGHGPTMAPEPQVPSCRGLVTMPAGEPPPEVRWFGPGHEDEASRHFRHCRAVGPSVVLRSPKPTGPVDSVAIVSFNMALGKGALALLLDSVTAGRYSDGAPIRDLVVLLQETFREGAAVPIEAPRGAWTGRGGFASPAFGERLDVLAVATKFGLHAYYSAATRAPGARNPSGHPEDWGNAILSSVPLESLGVVDLPYGGTRRIAQLATVRGQRRDGQPWILTLANVHFSVGPVGPSALSAIRARQARAMAAILDSVPAVALGGDLNAFSLLGTAESVQILERAFPESPPGDPSPTRGWQRLDYLFFRLPSGARASTYRRLPTGFGSDHAPVLSWVVF